MFYLPVRSTFVSATEALHDHKLLPAGSPTLSLAPAAFLLLVLQRQTHVRPNFGRSLQNLFDTAFDPLLQQVETLLEPIKEHPGAGPGPWRRSPRTDPCREPVDGMGETDRYSVVPRFAGKLLSELLGLELVVGLGSGVRSPVLGPSVLLHEVTVPLHRQHRARRHLGTRIVLLGARRISSSNHHEQTGL
jgi:hypothetical protein